MSQESTSLNALAASASMSNLALKLSDNKKDKTRTIEAQVAAVLSHKAAKESDGIIDTVQEMFLDIESYREELDESLEDLAASLSDLDQGIEKMESLTITTKQNEPEILTVRQQKDALEVLFEELFNQLNQYGAGAFVDVQDNVSAERALFLLRN